MLKILVNEAEFKIRLDSETPLLIKGGIPDGDTDMSPVRTNRGATADPYVPGASARGVLRSHAERIARTLAGQHPERGACDPFAKDGPGKSCSNTLEDLKKRDRKLAADIRYARSCPICRLFGSLALQSRLQVGDFYALEAADRPTIERRDGVGIDRVTGGATRGALFNLEAAVGGKYTGALRIRNFELWQLGLLAFVLRDLTAGELTFGTGGSRGFGQIKGELLHASIRQFLPGAPSDRIVGMAIAGPMLTNYDVWMDARETAGIAPGVAGTPDDSGLGTQFLFADSTAVLGLLRAAAPVWPAFMETRRNG